MNGKRNDFKSSDIVLWIHPVEVQALEIIAARCLSNFRKAHFLWQKDAEAEEHKQ